MSERVYGPCVKCGGGDILVKFHEGKPAHCWLCSVESCRWSPECGERGTEGEHLQVHCRRCQHGWREPVGLEADNGVAVGASQGTLEPSSGGSVMKHGSAAQ